VFRAWDFDKPVVLAPAMNTFMWENPITQKHLGELKLLRSLTVKTIRVVEPQAKVLACGDEGVGAIGDLSKIVEAVNKLNKKTADTAALVPK
jgi:phosphopantothenoylcysteine decarboxylase